MLFSCKISNAVITYLEKQDEDLSYLLESTPLPEEFLRDPNYWMEAHEMEAFLEMALRFSSRLSEDNLFQKIGHMGPDLRSWGVLDSVIRMMPRPQEILAQPERFLSYFISPQPPVENLHRKESSIEFDLPISNEQYPLIVSYLKSAFESLPVYVGKNIAYCEWLGIHLVFKWENHQETLFQVEDVGHQVSPDLLRNVVDSLEKQQRELEKKTFEVNKSVSENYSNEIFSRRQLGSEKSQKEWNQKALIPKDYQSEFAHFSENFIAETETNIENETETEIASEARSGIRAAAAGADQDFNLDLGLTSEPRQELGLSSSLDPQDFRTLINNISRLGDYMVRAQQLIIMLTGSEKTNPAIKAAMRRVDWERIRIQFPETVRESIEILESTEKLSIKKQQKMEQKFLQQRDDITI